MFDIPITINWKAETGLKTAKYIHKLHLMGEGRWGSTKVKINKYVLDEVLNC